ncbi:hypothetical protein [Streptosporangium sp. NPDC002524]|uniref:hypothetical protein n=1 Tax=Streptosporangium sp. NPDC002524 TaxID=3154537 RepID=UPI003326B733
MSRIYFASPSGQAELLGPEYARLSRLCRRIAEGLMDPRGVDILERLQEMVPPSHSLSRQRVTDTDLEQLDRWASSYLTAFHLGDDGLMVYGRHPGQAYGGRPVATFDLAFNTALQVGSDTVKLAARIYGQAEIHGYVEGPNRAWLAGLIDRGLAEGVLRRGFSVTSGSATSWLETGWREVAEFLRSRDDEPVVMNGSLAGNFFPSVATSGWTPPEGTDPIPASWRDYPAAWEELGEDERDSYREEEREELFDALDVAEQWRVGMQELRRLSKTQRLELEPDGWDDFRYGHRLSVLDLQAEDWRIRFERALDAQAAQVAS